MKFTLKWLKQYIDCDLPASELAERLTMAGLEVDAVEPLYPDLTGIKVGKIIEVNKHPDADRLVLCDVEVGDETKRVVCGAPNARVGLVTAIALPGAVMPAGFKIKKSKLRGQVSEGMLCSANELLISTEKSGIMELPADLTSGSDLSEALDLDDIFIEVDLTPNRADCASVIGTAREVGGFTGNKLRTPVSSADLPDVVDQHSEFSVEVNDQQKCPRYAASLIKNVKIGPSPWWLQRLLLAAGMRPINNVVDVTNFVMLEYGQPLHAFDYRTLAGASIEVRTAKKNEKITTLDGVERELNDDMLLICDAERPVAIAGVMGAENSEVTDRTTDILLESAYFDAVSIRQTAGKLKLGTDSSYRFERGVDPDGVLIAQHRAAQLIAELAGGDVADNTLVVQVDIPANETITFRAKRCSALLGMDFSADQLADMLTGIEIPVKIITDDTLLVSPPSFRVDLLREIDLVEEIARLHGYNDLPTSLPQVPMSLPVSQERRDMAGRVLPIMTGMGFYEAINYSFVTDQHFDMLALAADDPRRQAVKLLNPLAEDQSIMRTTLLPGLLENLKRNVNNQNNDVRLFEVGKVFFACGDEQPREEMFVCGLISGRRDPGAPVIHFGQDASDFYDVKGSVENLLSQLRIANLQTTPGQAVEPYSDPAICATLVADNQRIGTVGRINAACLKSFAIKQDAYYFECSIDRLLTISEQPLAFKPFPRFPSVRWDIAVLVPESVPGGDMLLAIKGCGEKIVEQAEIFDIYRGKNIDDGMKSVAISVTYRDDTATLDDVAVGKVHKKIIAMIASRFDGQLREA